MTVPTTVPLEPLPIRLGGGAKFARACDSGDRGAAGVTRAASVKPQQVPRNAAPIVATAVLTPPRPDKHRRKADQLMPVQA